MNSEEVRFQICDSKTNLIASSPPLLRGLFYALRWWKSRAIVGKRVEKSPKGGADMDKKQPPVSDNPIVAALPALLGDKKKLRALLAVIGAAFIVVAALALIAVA